MSGPCLLLKKGWEGSLIFGRVQYFFHSKHNYTCIAVGCSHSAQSYCFRLCLDIMSSYARTFGQYAWKYDTEKWLLGTRTTGSTGKKWNFNCRTVIFDKTSTESTEDTECWQHKQSGVWIDARSCVAPVPESNTKSVNTLERSVSKLHSPCSSSELHPPPLINPLLTIYITLCIYLMSGVCAFGPKCPILSMWLSYAMTS